MICYWADIVLANKLMVHLINAKDQKRILANQVIQNNAGLIRDYDQKILELVFHSLPVP
jgi:hypothetical protein